MLSVVGYPLEEAKRILSSQGIPFEVKITLPPRKRNQPENHPYQYRVVRQREVEGILELTVTRRILPSWEQ